MQIAELFVNLGIKGAEKTVSALGSVRKGLGEVTSMSLEAKAGLIGALYGFERLMAASGAMGTGLTNFVALTGLSAQSLQQWQYAARQAGVSNDEFAGSLKGVQNSMTNMLLGKGAPEGLNILQATVGLDMKRVRDPFYVMQQLQKAAQQLPPDAGNMILKSFGVSEGVISAMRRNAFRPEVFRHAPTYSDREIQSLDHANIAWSNLGNKIAMAFGHFNAAHGATLVNEISKVTDQVLKMVEAFERLAEKLKLFQVFGKIFEGWSLIFNAVGQGVNKLTGTTGNLKKNPVDMLGDWIGDRVTDIAGALRPSPVMGLAARHEQTNIVQHITHHGDAKDTASVGALHKNAINQAYRQRAAQRQGS